MILIRHGITAWNKERKYCGSSDVCLSPEGKKQAKKLQQRLAMEKIDKVYSSNKKRALQTAKIIFSKDKVDGLHQLNEIDFGCFEGLTHCQILKLFPELYNSWLKKPGSVRIPRAEKFSEFKKRVLCGFKQIIAKNKNKTVAVVCHGGSIAVLVSCIEKSCGFWQYIPSSASMTIIEFTAGKPRLMIFNDTSHLN